MEEGFKDVRKKGKGGREGGSGMEGRRKDDWGREKGRGRSDCPTLVRSVTFFTHHTESLNASYIKMFLSAALMKQADSQRSVWNVYFCPPPKTSANVQHVCFWNGPQHFRWGLQSRTQTCRSHAWWSQIPREMDVTCSACTVADAANSGRFLVNVSNLVCTEQSDTETA